jgi:ribonuclease HI
VTRSTNQTDLIDAIEPQRAAPEIPEDAEPVIIYTDGGCDPNPGTGAWATVLAYKGKVRELTGGEYDTTNNRMEMTAAIRALEALKRPCRIVLHTDSEYLRLGITQWLPGWKRRGWKRKSGEIKNADLWRHLDELASKHQITWKWVPGHAGVPENERCDELANQTIAQLKRARNSR